MGKTFGRWTVIGRAPDRLDSRGDKIPYWVCRCSCDRGTIREVRGTQLRANKSRSCGCISNEILATNNTLRLKRFNDYIMMKNYVIMYTSKNEPFLIDIEDFGKVYRYCWHKNKDGYLATYDVRKGIYLHRLIMNPPRNLRVDHIGGEKSRFDNRKENLRIATSSQNNQNKKLQSNNTSGVAGVCWHKDISRWVASITINGQYIHIGTYINKDEAIQARKHAEEKHFGEWSYDNSQQQRYGME